MHKKLIYTCLGVVGALGVFGFFLIYPKYTSSQSASVTLYTATTSANTATSSNPNNKLHIPIFIYHSVKPDTASETQIQKDYSVTPEMFEQQLQYLQQNGYTPITMSEFEREVLSGTTSPIAKPVLLGFDDGWENQYVYAYPLLKKYNMKAVFYIYTNPISRDRRFMSWGQIKELDAAGMEIADHTLTHPYLQKLSPEALRHEILDSKKKLEEELGKPMLHFASPFGYTSPEVVALLKEGGFHTGRTGHPGTYHSKDDLLTLTGYYTHRDLLDFRWILEHAK